MKPPRFSAEEIERYLAQQQASGLSLPVFCRKYALPYETLVFWRRKLHGPTRPRRRPPLSEFVPVQLKRTVAERDEPQAPHLRRTDSSMVVTLRAGRTIQVAADFDKEALRRLIEVVEAAAC